MGIKDSFEKAFGRTETDFESLNQQQQENEVRSSRDEFFDGGESHFNEDENSEYQGSSEGKETDIDINNCEDEVPILDEKQEEPAALYVDLGNLEGSIEHIEASLDLLGTRLTSINSILQMQAQELAGSSGRALRQQQSRAISELAKLYEIVANDCANASPESAENLTFYKELLEGVFEAMQVEIQPISGGEDFDQRRHQRIASVGTDDESLSRKIVAPERPIHVFAFSETDEVVVRGKVAVYVKN